MTCEKYLEAIKEEIEGAKKYAKLYCTYRTVGKVHLAGKYKEMCQDELRHARYIYEEALNNLNQVDVINIVDCYTEGVPSIKQMLSL